MPATPSSSRKRADAGRAPASAALDREVVPVAAKRHAELRAHLGEHVRREEVVANTRDVLAFDLDTIDRANEFTVRMRVPREHDRLAAVQTHLTPCGCSQRTAHVLRRDTDALGE